MSASSKEVLTLLPLFAGIDLHGVSPRVPVPLDIPPRRLPISTSDFAWPGAVNASLHLNKDLT